MKKSTETIVGRVSDSETKTPDLGTAGVFTGAGGAAAVAARLAGALAGGEGAAGPEDGRTSPVSTLLTLPQANGGS
jgi:hypothetical protein